MPEGHVLEFTHVTKRFNDVTAVSDFSARVEPGVVTAFLGPNGAGKTTSLRILLGQVRQTSGTATIGGVPYAELRTPLKTIGSVLEETVYRPRRSAARQLTIAAKANNIPLSRVEEVLELVGLDGEREGRIGTYSLGMRQRLSVAHALLGDAGTLVFDEPANGLDPEGIRWIRLLMRRLADEGRTVLVSSHVLSEVEQIADHVLVLSKGQLVLSSGIENLADPTSGSVVVDAADRVALTAALGAAGFEVEVLRSGLTVRGGDTKTIGAVAANAGIALSTLVQRGPTLEDVFIDLIRGGKLEPRAAIEAPADAAAAAVIADAPVDAEAEASVVTDAPAEAEAETPAAEAPAESEPADAAVVSEPEAAAEVVEPIDDAPADATDESTPSDAGRSFDDILFGSGESSEPEESIFDTPAETEADADPRSAAVSSMLAAAARAYYDDEPRPYPYGDPAPAEAETVEAENAASETTEAVADAEADADAEAEQTEPEHRND